MKQVPVSKNVWSDLLKLRHNLGYKNHSKTIGWLLGKLSSTDINNANQISVDEDIFQQLVYLRDKSNMSSFDAVIRAMLSKLEYYMEQEG